MWAWVEGNRDELTVVAAFAGVLVALAGVIVAGIYAYLTRGLLRATKQQADLTQQTFAASHRPYLLVTVNHSRSAGNITWVFELDNKGTVPAVLTEWQVTVRFDGQDVIQHRQASSDVAFAVVPGASETMAPVHVDRTQTVPIWGTGKPVHVEAVVRYRGVGPNVYVTRTTYEMIVPEYGVLWARRELRLDS